MWNHHLTSFTTKEINRKFINVPAIYTHLLKKKIKVNWDFHSFRGKLKIFIGRGMNWNLPQLKRKSYYFWHVFTPYTGQQKSFLIRWILWECCKCPFTNRIQARKKIIREWTICWLITIIRRCKTSHTVTVIRIFIFSLDNKNISFLLPSIFFYFILKKFEKSQNSLNQFFLSTNIYSFIYSRRLAWL